MSFKDALHAVSTLGFLKMLLPSWAMGLHKTSRKAANAFKDLEVCICVAFRMVMFHVNDAFQLYMMEMVRARRQAEYKGERHDLFTSLLDANTEETEKGAKLLDSELIGAFEFFYRLI